MSALPIPRRRIWWIKVAAASGMALLSLFASALTGLGLGLAMFHNGYFAASYWNTQSLSDVAGSLPIVACCFASALAVSPFLDRPVSAVVAGLLVGIGSLALLSDCSAEYVNYFGRLYGWNRDPHVREQYPIMLLLILFSLLVYGAISYWTFTRGEQLRSSKRFRIGAMVGGLSFSITILLFCFGSCLHWW